MNSPYLGYVYCARLTSSPTATAPTETPPSLRVCTDHRTTTEKTDGRLAPPPTAYANEITKVRLFYGSRDGWECYAASALAQYSSDYGTEAALGHGVDTDHGFLSEGDRT